MTEDASREQPLIAAAVITERGKVLLVRRRVAEGSLSWQLPAGGVEDGETPEEAAVREAGEETGVTVAAASFLGRRVHPTTGRHIAYIACRFVAGTAHVADDDEVTDVAWCDRQRVLDLVPGGLWLPVQEYIDAAA